MLAQTLCVPFPPTPGTAARSDGGSTTRCALYLCADTYTHAHSQERNQVVSSRASTRASAKGFFARQRVLPLSAYMARAKPHSAPPGTPTGPHIHVVRSRRGHAHGSSAPDSAIQARPLPQTSTPSPCFAGSRTAAPPPCRPPPLVHPPRDSTQAPHHHQ